MVHESTFALPAWLLVPAAAGLASSAAHCAGMCGPIQLFVQSRARGGAASIAYHGGRIAGYSLLGMLAAGIGWALGDADQYRAYGAGFLIVCYVLFAAHFLGVRLPAAPGFATGPRRLFARTLGSLFSSGKPWGFTAAGLLAALLPCPSSWALLLFCTSLPGPGSAAASMAVFGAATLPAFALLFAGAAAGRAAGGKGLFAWNHARLRFTLGLGLLALAAWKGYVVFGPSAGPPACH